MIEEFSAGIIPLNLESKSVFLIQQRHGEHWGFAKGHIEEGEEPVLAAKRELFEETGIRVTDRLLDEEFEESYQFEGDTGFINKRVTYFVYRVFRSEYSIDEDEVMDGGWFSITDALDKLTFEDARSMLAHIAAKLEKELEL
jgi:bis(5'-nucleosidyl)-tetraphosphatase